MGVARPLPLRVQIPEIAAKGEAACWNAVQDQTARPDDWFPDNSRGLDPWNQRAMGICGGCPIRVQCLRWALRQMSTGPIDSLPGIWGGTTQHQRMKMVRHRYGL